MAAPAIDRRSKPWRTCRHTTLSASLADAVRRRGSCTSAEAARDVFGMDPKAAGQLLAVTARRPWLHGIYRVSYGRYGFNADLIGTFNLLPEASLDYSDAAGPVGQETA